MSDEQNYSDDNDFNITDEDEEEDVERVANNKRQAYQKLNWSTKPALRSFETSLEATLYLEKKLKTHWRIKYRNHSKDCYTVILFCKRVKVASKRQCAAKMALIYNVTNQQVELKISADHDHQNIEEASLAKTLISSDENALILEMVRRKCKLSIIYNELKKRFPLAPTTYSQTQKAIKKLKAKTSISEFSFGDLEDFLNSNLDLPSAKHLDQAYVINFVLDSDEEKFR